MRLTEAVRLHQPLFSSGLCKAIHSPIQNNSRFALLNFGWSSLATINSQQKRQKQMENTQPKLFTNVQFETLIKNGSDTNHDKDYLPVVKLFMTNTACTWLISELDPEYPDIAFGLCDLGMGFPELGSVSIQELVEAQSFLRNLQRDTSFEGKYPLSVYARAARGEERITEDETALKNAATKLKL
jgi:hypothetical protein